jgi:4'-phosphopantetheinyl transferase
VDLIADAARYVSQDEIQRADRLLDPRKRDRFLACRGLLREILGNYLGLQPERLHFAVGANGKPFLAANSANNSRLHFNLSHSGTLFLLAIAADREVGIDIERLRDDTPFHDIARLAFSPREQDKLFAIPHHLQRSAFYRCWTRKEAYMKACGMGFALPSNSFTVSLLPSTPANFILPDETPGWHIVDIAVPEDYSAALAVQGHNPFIRLFS